MQHQITAGQHLFEILCLVVDHDIGPKPAHQIDIRGAGRRGHRCPKMLCQMDRDGADTAVACLDKDLLSRLYPPQFHKRLPCGQPDQRDRSGFLHRQAGGFKGQIGAINRDGFGKGADAVVTGASVDCVPHLEPPHICADADDGSGHVVPKDERRAIGQEQLELAIAKLAVQLVERGSVNPHQNVIRIQLRLGHVGQAQRALLLVLVDNKGFHRVTAG